MLICISNFISDKIPSRWQRTCSYIKIRRANSFVAQLKVALSLYHLCKWLRFKLRWTEDSVFKTLLSAVFWFQLISPTRTYLRVQIWRFCILFCKHRTSILRVSIYITVLRAKTFNAIASVPLVFVYLLCFLVKCKVSLLFLVRLSAITL